MITKARAIGSHASFFRDGVAFSVPSAGTCAREDKPGAADTGWIALPVIKKVTLKRSFGGEHKIKAPSPGQLRMYDIIRTGPEMSLTLTLSEISPLVLEQIFGCEALTDQSTQFNPLEDVVTKGWLKGQFYDHEDVLFLTGDMYIDLNLGGDVEFGESPVEAEITATILHSTLNTFTIS